MRNLCSCEVGRCRSSFCCQSQDPESESSDNMLITLFGPCRKIWKLNQWLLSVINIDHIRPRVFATSVSKSFFSCSSGESFFFSLGSRFFFSFSFTISPPHKFMGSPVEEAAEAVKPSATAARTAWLSCTFASARVSWPVVDSSCRISSILSNTL